MITAPDRVYFSPIFRGESRSSWSIQRILHKIGGGHRCPDKGSRSRLAGGSLQPGSSGERRQAARHRRRARLRRCRSMRCMLKATMESTTARAKPSAPNGKSSNADFVKQMQFSAVTDIRDWHRRRPSKIRPPLAPDAPKASVTASRRVAASSGPSTAYDTWKGRWPSMTMAWIVAAGIVEAAAVVPDRQGFRLSAQPCRLIDVPTECPYPHLSLALSTTHRLL